jgi:O-6-methylguanine DNA methyltransferase
MNTTTMDAAGVLVHVTHFETPLGWMLAGATGEHVVLLHYVEPDRVAREIARLSTALGWRIAQEETELLARLRRALGELLGGARREVDVPIRATGSPFQAAVWSELRRIPRGQTRSYGAIANAIGRPDAVRAVARANHDNPIAILIPCHRVVGSDGRLVGYGGGLWRKRWLLALESDDSLMFR